MRPFTTNEAVKHSPFTSLSIRGVEDLDNIVADEGKLQEDARIVNQVHREEGKSTLDQAASFLSLLVQQIKSKIGRGLVRDLELLSGGGNVQEESRGTIHLVR